jgi:pimeloyl-ACP methyl ester carboxylesterase
MHGNTFLVLSLPAVEVNGVNISYEEAGSGEAIVFVHGLWVDRRCWLHQKKHFTKDFKVVIYDLRGHGESGKPSKQYSVWTHGEDLYALIKHLGLKQANIVGHSMGGMVACVLAVRHPEVVKRLVLADTMCNVIPEAVGERVAWVKKMSMEEIGRLIAKRGIKLVGEDAIRLVVDMVKGQTPEVYVRNAVATSGFNICGELKKIDKPTLIIVGGKDEATPAWMAETLHRLIPNSELYIMKGAGHLTCLDNPKEFNKAISDFLSKT